MRRKDDLDTIRHQMVDEQIRHRGITDERILRAMETIPRHLFVPYSRPKDTYRDGPLPIGQGQTISQPYITAYMTNLLQVQPTDRVLEIGTGSGYQAALLGLLCAEVYSVEIIAAHHVRARKILEQLNYANIDLKIGDGRKGWPEKAPFDGIIVTAAAENKVPRTLLEQLVNGGRLVTPVGKTLFDQQLVIYTRQKDTFLEKADLAVRFVPLVEGNPAAPDIHK